MTNDTVEAASREAMAFWVLEDPRCTWSATPQYLHKAAEFYSTGRWGKAAGGSPLYTPDISDAWQFKNRAEAEAFVAKSVDLTSWGYVACEHAWIAIPPMMPDQVEYVRKACARTPVDMSTVIGGPRATGGVETGEPMTLSGWQNLPLAEQLRARANFIIDHCNAPDATAKLLRHYADALASPPPTGEPPRKTMTLNLTDEEMAALEEIAKAKALEPPTVLRHALKVLQLEVRGMATVTVERTGPLGSPPPAVGVTKEALARIEELAEAHRKFATAREAMNAARPAVDATQLERMLYGERYDADRAAEQAVFSLALKFAADASDILALFNGAG